MATSAKVLDDAMKLPVRERVRVAEKLLESAEAEGFEDNDEDAATQAAWAAEIQQRSNELKAGAVRGLSVDEARRVIATDPTDDER